MRPPKLTDKQKVRLKILETKLKSAIEKRDLKIAKALSFDLQALLRPTGHITRLIQSKNRLYELALEQGELDFAINGLSNNRNIVSEKTRLYLEATALLAICYLRKEDIENAKPLIKEVLENDSVLKSETSRRKFRTEIIERFNEEIALYSLKDKEKEEFSQIDLESEITNILATQNESEIYVSLGKSVPSHTRHLLYEVHQYSVKQLPSALRRIRGSNPRSSLFFIMAQI